MIEKIYIKIIIGNLHPRDTDDGINDYLKSLNWSLLHITALFSSNDVHSHNWLDENKKYNYWTWFFIYGKILLEIKNMQVKEII